LSLSTGVNPQTGELGTLVPFNSGYEITSEKQREQRTSYYARKRASDMRNAMRWVACYHDPIQRITKDLSLTEAGALIRLLPFLRFKADNALIKNGKPLNQSDIQNIIGRGKRVTIDILARLESLGVLAKEKSGRINVYSFNVDFHTYGNVQEGVKFTKLYQYHTNELTRDLDLNEIGLLYKILPYFHYQMFYLCANPDETDGWNIDHLTRETLAERIGHDPDTVSALVNRLQSKGVIMATKSRNSVRYIVHPDVMYRQEGEDGYAEYVRKQFEQHAK
jgi:predicted transcriptional regulator